MFAAALLFAACQAHADQIIGAGAVVSLGAATVSLGCSDLYVAGTLDFQQGSYIDVRNVFVQPGGVVNGGDGTLVAAMPVAVAPGGQFNPQQLTVQASFACGAAAWPAPAPRVIPAAGNAALLALALAFALFGAFVLRNTSREMHR